MAKQYLFENEMSKVNYAAGEQCRQVNPSNPLAVAQNIKGMYEALKRLLAQYNELAPALANYGAASEAHEVLTAIEKEK